MHLPVHWAVSVVVRTQKCKKDSWPLPNIAESLSSVFYLFERWRVTQRFSIAGSLSLGPQKSTLGQAEARDPEFILGLLHEWQECNYLNHHMPPSRMFISRKLESEVELQLEPRDSSMVSRRPKQQLRCNTRYLPYSLQRRCIIPTVAKAKN